MGDGSPHSGNRDDLDISSIGAIYRGPWDKKYWSSSRGKDRYPYPVGYHAVRTHGGNTYQMEIREGVKGPLFVVTSTDGDSSTGQTPNIAWENFQKKNGPRVKNRNGKRFSSKIDGVVLFGFRNPFVQRLLRELVANEHVVIEPDVLKPPIGNEASVLDNKFQSQGSLACTDLCVYSRKHQTAGKRSTMGKSHTRISKTAKRIRCQYAPNSPGAGNPEQLNGNFIHAEIKNKKLVKEKSAPLSGIQAFQLQGSQNHLSYSPEGNIFAVSNKTCYQAAADCKSDSKNRDKDREDLEILLGQLSTLGGNCNYFPARNELPQEMGDPDNSIEKHVIYVKETKLTSQDPHVTCVDNTCDADNNLLHRSSILRPRQSDLSSEAKESGEVLAFEKCSNVCVSDTCDTEKCDAAGFASERGSPCNMIRVTSTFIHPAMECSSLPDYAASKELIKDSLPEAVSSSGSSNPSSAKVDLKLAGEELAKSMMTFLLPRAVPLLEKTYVKRKSRHRSWEVKIDPSSTFSRASSAEEQVENGHFTGNIFQGEFKSGMLMNKPRDTIPERMSDPLSQPGVNCQCQMSKIEQPNSDCVIHKPFDRSLYLDDAKHMIPDSFEDDKYVSDVHTKKRSTIAYGIDSTASDKTREKIITSKPLIVEADRVEEPSNSGTVAHLPKETEKSEYLLTDSLVDCLKEAFNDDLFLGKEKVSDAPCNIGACVDHDLPYLNAGYEEDALEEMAIPEYMPHHNTTGNGKTECLEQYSPAANSDSNNLGERESSKIVIKEPPHMNGNINKELQDSNLDDPVELEICDTTEHKDCKLREQIGVIHTLPVGLNGESLVYLKGDSSCLFHMPNISSSAEGQQPNSIKIGKISNPPHFSGKCNVPISESIICRNYIDSDATDTYFAPRTSEIAENTQTRMIKESQQSSNSNKVIPLDSKSNSRLVSQTQDVAKYVNANMKFSKSAEENCADSMNKLHSSIQFCQPPFQECSKDLPDQGRNVLENLSFSVKNPTMMATVDENSDNFFHKQLNPNGQLDGSSFKCARPNKELGGPFELAGCYMHPNPVLSIFLRSMEDALQVSVICGLRESNERYIFIYRIPLKVQEGLCPSFIGYTPLVLPLLTGPSNGNTTFERSGLQFTPDGQSLVFLNSIKAPLCRAQSANFPFSTCKFECHEENAVRVGQVNFGYVLPLVKLTTIERVSCILVCEPNYLTAVVASGILHIWLMNCKWSGALEEFDLPSFDYLTPAIELKTIPKSDSLIVGHNGTGGFGLWDISKRVLLARFSIPGYLICQILPIGIFSFEDETILSAGMEIELMQETLKANDWVTEAAANPLQVRDDIAVWLLVSAALEAQVDNQLKEPYRHPDRCWRLALLAKNMVVMGNVLDPRASSVDASAGYGIIGTYDGFVYKWELSTGKKLANFLSLKCGSIVCTSVEAKSGALAVADDKCRLMILKQL